MTRTRVRGRYSPEHISLGWIALFSGPALVLYTVLVIVPILTAFVYGLFDWKGTTAGAFVGLGNYIELFTRYPVNEQIGAAFWHNVLFFIGTMLVQNTIGLGLAVLLHRTTTGKRLFQTLYSTPYLLSPLIVGYLWAMLLSPTFGPINAGLRAIGLDALALPWLGQPGTALPVLILINAWQWIGGPLLIFGAALGGIPQELEEAAALDGASPSRLFWSIRFPLIMPAVGIITVLTFIGCFNLFDLVYALGGSGGGPSGSMDVLGLLYYRLAFDGGTNAIGESSAMAVLMFALVFGVAIALERFLRRREVS
ncbi:raffinose/stachyose/melibiose transport system permease protein [Microbacterium trichothecenolyticum]|uniref:carbohydrate ABC transporter permease n=1 Tax=Microbacterium trichothecenolyticum TaxID=69370 RepID=UPI002858BE5B|nr:sugar ABC transporter permease [Microbacterium trichothecenolyticum]MDR7184436.1 raffinose/stachyose/melibiose transport system permease protein [Microbacterium trichothecenolyticum]